MSFHTRATRRDSLLCLPALLQLALALQLETEGSFEEVDGMLGCPLALFSPELLQAASFPGLPPPQQQAMALGLFHAANWLRELLNGFCSTDKLKPQMCVCNQGLSEALRTKLKLFVTHIV